MKLFHCGVDVTTNQWVYVEAENEQEAESLAERQVREDNNSGHPVASVDVHIVHETTD